MYVSCHIICFIHLCHHPNISTELFYGVLSTQLNLFSLLCLSPAFKHTDIQTQTPDTHTQTHTHTHTHTDTPPRIKSTGATETLQPKI